MLSCKSGLIDATAPDATELTAYLRGLPRPSLWRRPLHAAGHQLFPINPLAVSRYRVLPVVDLTEEVVAENADVHGGIPRHGDGVFGVSGARTGPWA